jgi:hypothetical protein
MILRIRKRTINTDTNMSNDIDNFFDNFDYAEVADVKYQEEKAFAEAVSCFASISTVWCKRISLLRNNNVLARIIYVDSNYEVYLMTNEGKTIERIN